MQLSVAERRYEGLKRNVALRSLAIGPTAAAQQHGLKRSFASYHERKLLDPNFHHGEWGGARNVKFTDDERQMLEVHLWKLVQENPRLLPAQFATRLNVFLGPINKTVNRK
jgi:hypothetical protein